MGKEAGAGIEGRRPSMKDVAQRAGVSWKTVSNVVNGRRNVGPETRTRVEEAILELGYRTNVAGQQLRSGRTRILALALPELTTPYFAELAHEVIRCAECRGYTVLISETDSRPEKERAVARGFDTRFADGIIFNPVALDSTSVLEQQGPVPLVLLGERIDGSRVDHVIIDNITSGRTVADHLIELGRRRIAFIGASEDRQFGTGWLRMIGYRQSLENAGHQWRPSDVMPAKTFSHQGGADAVHRLVTNGMLIDAVIAANDVLAMGAMYALRQAGLAVPGDVAVTGWDNADEGAFSNPTLTTIALDISAIAEAAVDLVVSRIEGSAGAPAEVIVPHRLVVRESTVGVVRTESRPSF